MAVPVSEQIAVVVKGRLENISTENGYETTVAEVIRPKLDGEFNPKDNELYLEQGDKGRSFQSDCPGNPEAIAWTLPFSIHGILRPSNDSTSAYDTLKNTFEADVQKALATNSTGETGDWAQMNNLAITSQFSGVTNFIASNGSEVGFEVILTVTYRVPVNDPYTVRA